MAKRLQSPSSINTFKQCPRKYFYQYKVKHPTKDNIHCARGNIVHEALEKFYEMDIGSIDPSDFKKEISFYTKNLFDACWGASSHRLKKLGLTDEVLSFYYNDSTQMLANWLNHFFDEVDSQMKTGLSFHEAYEKLKPHSMEEQFSDDELMVRGFIDVIHKDGDDVLVLDYKTSKTDDVKDEYLLQLGIYALLYERKHGEYPKKVGLWFLKHRQVTLEVTPQLIKDALFEIEQIHIATESDTISDYPKKITGLCKYSSGQCDFYDICQKDR